MSQLQTLILNARSGLSIAESITDAQWLTIAKQCGAAEIAEVELRIAGLREELETVDDWDGDAEDDIHLAISRFTRLLVLAKSLQQA